MPNDKGDDELFEDLDKFFAPIRDVDWDEPDDATTQAPQETHVEVRAEPAAPAPEPTGELPVVAAPEEPDAGDAWYDSGALAPIDELLGESEPADVDDDVVLVVDEDDGEDEAGQHGLFEEDDDEWTTRSTSASSATRRRTRTWRPPPPTSPAHSATKRRIRRSRSTCSVDRIPTGTS